MTELQIRQAIDAGVPIQRLAGYFSNVNEAIDFYIAHLQARFPNNPCTVWLKWKIVYYSKKNLFFKFLEVIAEFLHVSIMVRMGAETQQEKTFFTCHPFGRRELRQMRLRHIFSMAGCSMFNILSIMFVGGTVALAGILVWKPSTYVDNQPGSIYIGAFGMLALISIYISSFLVKYPLPSSLRFITASRCELIEIGNLRG